MDTTTDGGGVAPATEPQEPTAVSTEESVTSQESTESTNAVEAEVVDETQQASEQAVDETQADDVKEWAEKKGLPLDDPVKLAQMYRDAERKMHEATQPKPVPQPLETIAPTGNPEYDALVDTVNNLQMTQRVNEFFARTPDAEQYRADMARLANERPWLTDLDAIYALAKTDPNREASLKAEGGKQALTNLAQKQSAITPKSSATNSASYETGRITPQNVNELVANNDNKWFTEHYDEINQALSGN